MNSEDKYILDHSSKVNEALDWLERETHLRTNHARMLSGPIVGSLIHEIVIMTGARKILELGVFTGYSSICLASALPDDGYLDAVEINDEIEDLIREGYRKAGVSDKINLRFGDAKEIVETLEGPYDLVYIDANKREYPQYFSTVIDKVRKGGYIIADNVLWDGKVYAENPSGDAQTQGIISFNEIVASDVRVTNFILPLRDGLNIIRKTA